tara:strand:- start:15838 stop:18414 length:2577 start_codon:yes stop_codon:yes gene_type:complete
MTEGIPYSEALERLFEKTSLAIVVVSVLFTAAMMQVLMDFPGFTTEISSFAPESDSDSSEDRVNEEMGATPHLLYIDVRPYSKSANGGNACDDSPCNVLELGALQQLAVDLDRIEQYSNDNGVFIISHLNAAGIIQTALNERDEQARNLSEFPNWTELLNAISDGEECSDAIGNDQAIASASFAASAMLHTDFDYDPVCEWLDSGEGDPSPVASSTMWVIEISGDISNEERRDLSAGIRDLLSDGGVLNYGVISDDLISHDINKSTMDNLVWLLLIAVLVVVALLALAFRSFMMVAAPLMGLSAALVWTYGIVTLLGMQLSVLEVAVAPVVLGLGIDYSIHLQRAYESSKNRSGSAAKAWVESISVLRLALSLAVVTTVFAFLANTFSELPPLRTFGFTLALGVVSAFVASTITVGAVHVVVEKSAGEIFHRGLRLDGLADVSTRFQRRNTARVLLIVAMITMGSVIVAIRELDTSFELTDFLSEEGMDIMEVRNDIYESYDAAAWKSVILLIEPQNGDDSLGGDDRDLLRGLERLDSRISGLPEVVNPSSASQRPSYDGLYPILRDAVENDPSFGETHHLGIFDGGLGPTGGFSNGDVSAAVSSLLRNESIGDPLRGDSWSERIGMHVALNEDETAIKYLRMRVDVLVSNSEEAQEVSDVFTKQAQLLVEDGLVGGQVHVTGDVIVLNNVLSGLVLSQVESTAISLFVSMLVLVLLTRRLGQSLVVILPVGLAGAWVVGAMAMLGINWNVLTIMITALTIGLGIDYSIHVWRRIEANRNSGMRTWEAMRDMYSTTGTALLLSAGTTICGFMVLLLSPIPVIQDFGVVSSISVLFSLVMALLVLPGLLAAEFRSGNGY